MIQKACAAAVVACAGLAIHPAGAGTPGPALRSFARPDTIPFPAENPYTPEKAALGKMLFFDPRLSRASNQTCASCHNPSFGWEVPVAGAVGAQNTPLPRHAPTVLNRAWGREMFWDGRASSLEEQAKGPIEAAVEMDMPLDRLVERLSGVQGYVDWFERVYPGLGITEDTIVGAIATFERTVVSGTAPFDRWVEGDETALGEDAKRGFDLFVGEARCAECHSGWNFTDESYHDVGMFTDDLGLGAMTGRAEDAHKFKTPGLRDIEHRAPYMHDGSLGTLEATVWHYVGGGVERPTKHSAAGPLDLDADDVADLVAFMRSLTGDVLPTPLPILPN